MPNVSLNGEGFVRQTRITKTGAVDMRADYEHPWRLRSRRQALEAESKKKRTVTKDMPTTTSFAWRCPNCGASDCDFGECAD